MTLLEIGRVAKPHGLRGELRVRLHWAESDALWKVHRVELALSSGVTKSLAIESVRRGSPGVLLKLSGIDCRDDAELLREAGVLVEREALPPLEPDEYYLSDLIGFRVTSPRGPVGEVVEVRTHPSVDTIVVRRGDGRCIEQPLLEPWLASVDVEERQIVLNSEEGVIE